MEKKHLQHATQEGYYTLHVEGYLVPTLVQEHCAADQCAEFIRTFGVHRVMMLNYQGATMSLPAALKGKLELA